MFQSVGHIVIITVEPVDHIPCCHSYAFVDRIALTAILFTHPVIYILFVLLYYGNRIVRAVPINNNVLKIGVILVKYRIDRLLKILSLVIRRGDDCDTWIVQSRTRLNFESREQIVAP